MAEVTTNGTVHLGKLASTILSGVAVVLLAGSIASIFHHVSDGERHENDPTKRARIREEIVAYHTLNKYPFSEVERGQLDELRIAIAEIRVIVLANQTRLKELER